MFYRIFWDSEDYRFYYYNETYWKFIDNAKEQIRLKAREDYEKLRSIYEDDAYNGSYEEWIDWCIENFLYINKCKLEDSEA